MAGIISWRKTALKTQLYIKCYVSIQSKCNTNYIFFFPFSGIKSQSIPTYPLGSHTSCIKTPCSQPAQCPSVCRIPESGMLTSKSSFFPAHTCKSNYSAIPKRVSKWEQTASLMSEAKSPSRGPSSPFLWKGLTVTTQRAAVLRN